MKKESLFSSVESSIFSFDGVLVAKPSPGYEYMVGLDRNSGFGELKPDDLDVIAFYSVSASEGSPRIAIKLFNNNKVEEDGGVGFAYKVRIESEVYSGDAYLIPYYSFEQNQNTGVTKITYPGKNANYVCVREIPDSINKTDKDGNVLGSYPISYPQDRFTFEESLTDSVSLVRGGNRVIDYVFYTFADCLALVPNSEYPIKIFVEEVMGG